LEKIKATFEALERKVAGRDDTLVKKKDNPEDLKADSLNSVAIAEISSKLQTLEELVEMQKNEIENLKRSSAKEAPGALDVEKAQAADRELLLTKYEELNQSMSQALEESKKVVVF
jgi:hypothetical protein